MNDLQHRLDELVGAPVAPTGCPVRVRTIRALERSQVALSQRGITR